MCRDRICALWSGGSEQKAGGSGAEMRFWSENDTAKEIVSMIFWWMDWEKGRRKSQSRSRSRKMSADEMQEKFPEIMECLIGEILGENESLSEVRHDLELTGRLEPYGLSVQWESGKPELLSDMGLIGSEVPESGEEVVLDAGISNGTTVLRAEIKATVFPEEKTVGRNLKRFWRNSRGRTWRRLRSAFLKALRDSHSITVWHPAAEMEV